MEVVMSVKASVSISERQEAFARGLVGDGRYASLSAVVQCGLHLLREDIETREAERVALQALMRERAEGPFVTGDEGGRDTEAMLAAKRRERRL